MIMLCPVYLRFCLYLEKSQNTPELYNYFLSRSPAFAPARTSHEPSQKSSSSSHNDNNADIHTIPEESEEEDLMSPSQSPLLFGDSSEDQHYHHLAASPDNSDYLLQEKRDGSGEPVSVSVMPWRGLLKKANSKVNLNEWCFFKRNFKKMKKTKNIVRVMKERLLPVGGKKGNKLKLL